MTFDELETELTILGNNQPITDESLLILSVNRALRRLYNDLRIVKEVRIAARTIKPISYYKEIYCKSGEFMEFPLNGKAYSMRFHGSGKYMITDGDVTNTYTVDSKKEAKVIKGFLSYGGKISFWGSFSFTVYDFAVYDEIFSPQLADIPEEGSHRVFDLREMYGDFMSFISPPADSDGNLIDCNMQDGKIEIDSSFEGEIILRYRRLPTKVISTMEIQTLDVPEEYLHLFCLLAAAYYWYYTDDGLSGHYEELYEGGIESMRKGCYDQINCSYVDTNGWA